jgi:hypothetical protein
VIKYRDSEEGKEVVAWALEEFEKAARARSTIENSWRRNLAYTRNQPRIDPTSISGKIAAAKTPDQDKRRKKRTINRIRSFVRSEHSKFVSKEPTVSIVPSSSEDSDFRAASAGEQVWRSLSSAGHLDTHVSEGMWWKVTCGNSFIKTYWDGTALDPVSGETGTVRYGSVSPFHLFVPDLREISLEEQPFIFNGYAKTSAWAKRRYPKELKGVPATDLALARKIGGQSTPEIVDYPESVVLLEMWVKPGANKHLPEGGLLHLVGSTLVGATKTFPYMHGLYPYTHLNHLYTGGFYRDSALDDLVDLQDEYNEIRSDISRAGRSMARPQLIVTKGSYAVAKHSNEIGLLIEVNPGMQPPQPLPMSELPSYYVQQLDRVLSDIEDISGQHEVSRGQAPGQGVTAGTAIAYLQESDDQFLTPQYRADERAYEKIARQSLELFVQYVSMKRKIKSVGADRSFDTMELSGADIRFGTDVRVEKGSTMSTSQVARRAEIKEMFSLGLLTPEQAVEMLEMGGSERLKETMDVARSKAQRENTKIKNLSPEEIIQTEDEALQHATQELGPEGMWELVAPDFSEQDPVTGEMVQNPDLDPQEVAMAAQDKLRDMAPAMIVADDFDLHEVHIEAHNQFRMSQEYEQLDPSVQDQFKKHIEMHTEMNQAAQQAAFMQQIPGDGTEGDGPQSVDFGPAPFEDAAMAAEGMDPAEAPVAQTAQPGPTGAAAPPQGAPPQNASRADMLKGGAAPQTPGL